MKVPDERIRREIRDCGVLPFARFMELALYCPETGYYEKKGDSPGRRGDFYTSVSVGDLFGHLLAFQFARWLEAEFGTGRSGFKAQIVEAGAHDGQLAADILGWLQSRRPALFEGIEYVVLEPSPRRREWQRETLERFAPRVRWSGSANAAPLPRVNGIVFGNELLDAMPVHRLGWDAKAGRWFEWGVAVEGGTFVWTKIQKPAAGSQALELDVPSFIAHLPSSLLDVLPDGYTIEISPAAEQWWRDAANALGRGKLLTLDYGLTGDELFSPARPRGTLRAYFRHHAADDLLANVGEQDLTAHVNFSAIRKTGEDAGLKTEFFSTQAKFLTGILAGTKRDKTFGDWTPARGRQFQTLTHPEHLGRAFRVLVQSRSLPRALP